MRVTTTTNDDDGDRKRCNKVKTIYSPFTHLDRPPLYSFRFFLKFFVSLLWKYTCHAHMENIRLYKQIQAKFISFALPQTIYSWNRWILFLQEKLQNSLIWLGLSTFFYYHCCHHYRFLFHASQHNSLSKSFNFDSAPQTWNTSNKFGVSFARKIINKI